MLYVSSEGAVSVWRSMTKTWLPIAVLMLWTCVWLGPQVRGIQYFKCPCWCMSWDQFSQTARLACRNRLQRKNCNLATNPYVPRLVSDVNREVSQRCDRIHYVLSLHRLKCFEHVAVCRYCCTVELNLSHPRCSFLCYRALHLIMHVDSSQHVQGMTLNCIHIFIVTGSFLYWCVMRLASQSFFIHSFYLFTNLDNILFSNVTWH